MQCTPYRPAAGLLSIAVVYYVFDLPFAFNRPSPEGTVVPAKRSSICRYGFPLPSPAGTIFPLPSVFTSSQSHIRATVVRAERPSIGLLQVVILALIRFYLR